ncbi:hypothetical protein [Synechococcus sp. O70.1]|uniref:hypothetical protein n=1 Tax=Synechococcus sp. O70.1 TaxID=2964535 RepID=UPI0039C0D961
MRSRGVRAHLFRWVGLLHLIAGVAYLYWRITEGLTDLGSLLFWGAEAYVWLAAVGFTLSRYAQVPSETLPSPEVLQPAFSQLPRVDVLVIRQRDSLEATRQTVLSALRLDYPWERLFVHIVDRVEDREMAKVAQAIPCEYWPCPSPTTDPLAYLLGSGHLQGEYLLLLQPGHFVEPDFLWQTLPLFYDFPERAPIANSTGFVQAMLRTLGRPQAVHPLQQLLAVGSHGYQAAPLLGSGCLIRRAALEGIPHTSTFAVLCSWGVRCTVAAGSPTWLAKPRSLVPCCPCATAAWLCWPFFRPCGKIPSGASRPPSSSAFSTCGWPSGPLEGRRS